VVTEQLDLPPVDLSGGWEVDAEAVVSGDVLRRRHRGNLRGGWIPIAQLSERRVGMDQVAVWLPEDGAWARVVFPHGGPHGGGRPKGKTDTTKRKSRKKADAKRKDKTKR
jgi:hypothetical protein